MLYASETQPLTKPNRQHLQRNDRVMIRQICNVKPQDIVTTRPNELLAWLDIEDLDLILKERRLRWYGHGERSNGAVKTAFDLQPVLALTVKIRKSLDFLAPVSEVLVIKFFPLTFRNSTSIFLNSHLWSKTAILKLNNTYM